MEKVQELLQKRSVQVGIGVFVALFLLVGGIYGKMNGLRHEGVDRETALTAQYLSNQNELSAFISTFHEQVGIADRNAAQLNTVLEDAVKGRYDDTGLQAGLPGEGNELISAMVEAYPDLAGLSDQYATILDTISAGREAYKNKQDRLLDMLRAYDRWRNEGIISSILIDISGFPSGSLRAQVGENFVTGQDALDEMYQIVLTSAAVTAYETGELDPLEATPLGEG